MINAITGKTGSGKTFLMVKLVYKRWLNGEDIYSNTYLSFPNQIDGRRFTIEERPDAFSFFEHFLWWITRKVFFVFSWGKIKPMNMPQRGKVVYFTDINEIMEIKDGVILFDEAQVLFNARNWEALPYEFQYKLQQSRKHNLELFCTAQNLGTIDITYRRLIHNWLHCDRGFTIGNDPVLFGFFKILVKDIDMLYNNVDDLKVPALAEKTFIIHRWKRRLYDTYYDIGFKPLKTICLTHYNQKIKKLNLKLMIIPKRLSLKDALRLKSTIASQLGLNKSKSYRTY